MKKIILVVIAGLFLSGCTAGIITSGAKLFGVSDANIARVQEYAKAGCAFVPYAKTVRDLFATGKFQSEFALADEICRAVALNPKAEGPGRSGPRLAGVRIQGKFVRR